MLIRTNGEKNIIIKIRIRNPKAFETDKRINTILDIIGNQKT